MASARETNEMISSTTNHATANVSSGLPSRCLSAVLMDEVVTGDKSTSSTESASLQAVHVMMNRKNVFILASCYLQSNVFIR